ncbi:MAG: hypothetical protein UU73_C0002G0190 [Candidatus Daviesbacteria bacterium GW2011_GWA1_41_61]|uniref:Uncharacterized protein n=1 Tax=Candidatus Daviesbacteria bacterium GW2011_GWA2_40_9 TaxID=1618424 RepID=A0A0G0U2Z3_9BACT|nr:MAG: hypothetical protein UU26_C0009G0011 [Candidatus Daviesbacteria bacterium GW2011_GWC1_40_9]KKR83468.1 MAG: hypothetical protein UU29_C0005G0049 [Candidatus Daviesbacteria bacterium GW2011_GWA2_40_9]KKR93850.1 MAG: hypothetical protein UU44_C0001G0190 [Candidatus Daviesbacteria bacterium GW2011_GWB1_41_15]KKS15316.1 MAG: hypothetical protein UU73_C0002G0190 [Candidatus Daviesbacteria bacterium GW2011_GWA1_41_61]
MIQAERFLAETVARLPEGSERARLAGWLQEARDYNANKKPEAASKIDLRQQTYDLLTLVRKPSEQEREVLKRRGIVFLPLETKSYAQVVSEDPDYFWSGEGELDYANIRPELRDYALPVAVEVGFNPTQLALPDSFRKSRPVQLQMIEGYSQQLQAEFPDARVVMLPSTGYAQGDRAYKVATGEVLFRNYFARALDNLSEVDAAYAGRLDPSRRFFVHTWFADDGLDFVGAVPAVVFVGNK